MKRLFVLLVAVIICFSLVSPIFAAGETVNSVRAAQIMAGVKLDALQGNFSFNRGKNEWVSYSLQMKVVGNIAYTTYLEKYGEVIIGEGDKPLVGLPENAVGETRNFYLYLSTPNGEAFGEFRKDLLLPGEPIEISMGPNNVQRVVPFTGKGTTTPENAVLKTDSGNTFGYASYAGGFPVWVNPFKTTAYTIMDTTTGLVIASGVIDPAKNSKPAETNSAVNIRIVGGVVEVSGGYLGNQVFNGQLSDGTPAKVYIWTLNGGKGDINAWAKEGTSLSIKVLRWVPLGSEMSEISASKENKDGYGYAFVDSGYDKVIVVITGTAEKFDIDFSAQGGTSGGGGGGGKG